MEHFDPLDLTVFFCKHEVQKRVMLSGLKQVSTVVDAKYVVMLTIVGI